jgi:sulfite exporter TauE/SafE
MTFYWSALLVGFLGSFHCVGMCGPIALSLSGNSNHRFNFLKGRIFYNAGRIITYSAMGIGAGFIGQGFSLAGVQQWLSLLIGLLLVLVLFIPSLLTRSEKFGKPAVALNRFVKQKFSYLLRKKSTFSLFGIGLVNGLLPCGLVYVALAASLALGGIQQGATYMFFFGLGTLPMMLAVSLAGNLVSLRLRSRINRMIPAFVFAMGLLFILRGLSLGIPYVSPAIQQLEAITGITICTGG